MTQKLLQFGNRPGIIYTFPIHQESFRDNFASAIPNTVRLPSLSGGFDQFGVDNAPQEIGRVQATIRLVSDPTSIEDLRDDIKRIREWGVQRLYMQPAKTGANPRWCLARVNNIDMPQDFTKLADWTQTVNLDFQVADPHWYADGATIPIWGDSSTKWGDGVNKWGGIVSTTGSVTGVLNQLSFSPVGNADTPARVVIMVGGNPLTGPFIVEHVVAGQVVDKVTYAQTTIPAFTTLEIDPRTFTFYVNNVENFNTFWSYTTPRVLVLSPVASVQTLNFRTSDANPTHNYTAFVYYSEAYL